MLDFRGLADRLLADAETHVTRWLPEGKRRGNEYKIGSLAGEPGESMSINLRTGRWADFASGERGGDLIDLYAAIHHIELAEAYRELDGDRSVAVSAPPRREAPKRLVITPVPAESADCDCIHPDYGPPVRTWCYQDGNGDVLGYVARYEPKGARKQIVPWTFTADGWGRGSWPAPRPLYRLHDLEARPDDPVLIVEGEKAADAAAAWADPYSVVSWPGGSQALHLADWRPVFGRQILLWPDADDAGRIAMLRLAEILRPHCNVIKIINPTGQPDGWDAADADFRTWTEARAWLLPRVSLLDAPPPPPAPPPAPKPRPAQQPAGEKTAEQAVNDRDASSLQPSDWFSRYAYVIADDSFFDLVERSEIGRNAFNALYRHVRCNSIHSQSSGAARRIEASVSFDENRHAMNAKIISGVTYAPGRTVLVEHVGQAYGNKWRDGRPVIDDAGDPGPWLAHVEKLVPEAEERNHMLDAFAYKVQNPGVKINHALLIGGVPGAGKDSMIAPLLYAIGGQTKQNCVSVDPAELSQPWGYYLENEVVIFNELRQSEATDRRALENKLKPILAAPPELLTVQRKNAHHIQVVNQALVLAMTNYRDAIAIPSDDRRWFVIWTHAQRMEESESRSLWAWFNAGGLEAGARYLRERDVSRFQPGATPPWTPAKQIMVSSTRSHTESWIIDRIEKRVEEFRWGVISGPWALMVDRLQTHAPPSVRLTQQALQHALAEAGWLDWGMCKSRLNPNSRHVFAAPDWRGSKSEARDLCETHFGSSRSASVHEFRKAAGGE